MTGHDRPEYPGQNFIRVHGLKHPRAMGQAEIEAFLTYFATQRKVFAPCKSYWGTLMSAPPCFTPMCSRWQQAARPAHWMLSIA